MKSKIFSLFGLSVLVLVILISAVSADTLAEWSLTTDGTATSVATNVNAGTFTYSSGVAFNEFNIDDGANAEDWGLTATLDSSKYFEVTISPTTDHTLTISDINFDYSASIIGPASFEIQYSTQTSFGSPTSITIEDDVSSTGATSSNSGFSIQVNSGETLTLRWFGYGFNAETNEFHIKDLAILGIVTPVTPEELNFCEYDDGVSNNPGELSVKIKDITNKGMSDKKFGDDEEWFPFEEIEVEVEIENKGDDDVDDIVLEWGLYNKDTQEWTIEVDEEDEFNLKDGDEETVIITFTIDDDMDEDLDELNGGDFVLYVRATGDIDGGTYDGEGTCASDSENIEIIIENDFVILNDIEFLETVQCGAEVQVTADVWNIGEDDQDDVYVIIYNKELGINEKIELGDIDAFEDEKLNAIIDIPQDAEEKYYSLTFWVYDEDDDLYENYDDKESEFDILIQVQGGCSVEPTAVVSASLESGGEAGEELIIKALITNTGDELTVYSLSVTEYSDWASLSSITPSTVVLGVGESKEVLVTFNVNEETSGDKMFNLVATADGEEAVKQPVSVSIQEPEVSGISGITGNVISEGNWYLWAIGALNILLIIIIIIVAMRVSKN